MSKETIWAKQVAEAFKIELPMEFIEQWKNDLSYVFPFQKKLKAFSKSEGYLKCTVRAENKAIEILNKYWTQLIREQL